MGPRNHGVALTKSEQHVIDSTNPCGAPNDGIEHRLYVRRRAADDAEHFRRCRLMLQRFAQFRIALLQFFEQPDVLDSDDGLSGESFQKRGNMFLPKRTDLRAANRNSPDRDILLARSGVTNMVRVPLSRWKCSRYRGNSVSISAATSWMWIVFPSIMARPTGKPRLNGR